MEKFGAMMENLRKQREVPPLSELYDELLDKSWLSLAPPRPKGGAEEQAALSIEEPNPTL